MEKRYVPGRGFAACAFLLLISGCGGGGGGTPPDNNPPPNRPPTVKVDAPEGELMELSLVTLSAAGSSDPDGDELTFSWKQVSGPEVALAENDVDSISFRLPKVRNNEVVDYVFELEASDGERKTIETVEFSPSVYEANGLVYVAKETADDAHVFFHHPAFESPLRLSDETEGPVGFARLLPQEKSVVYDTDGDTAQLFVASLDGVKNRSISGDIIDGGDITQLRESPDGKWVAVVGDLETDDVAELFLFAVDGSERVKVSGEITASDGNPDNGEIDGFVMSTSVRWLPDSSGVIFIGNLREYPTRELYLGLLDGSRRSLSHADADTGSVRAHECPFQVSDNSNFVSFCGNISATGNQTELYIADIETGERYLVHSHSSTSNSMDYQTQWQPGGNVLSFSDRKPSGANDLHLFNAADPSVGIRTVGGASDTDRDGDGVADGNVYNWSWSPDGAYLAFAGYLTDDSANGSAWLIPADSNDGSEAVKISPEIVQTANSASTTSLMWSPDSSRILMRSDANVDRLYELFSTEAPQGDNVVRISGPAPAHVASMNFMEWYPDNNTFIFTGDLDTPGVRDMYRAKVDGSGRTWLTGSNIADDGDASNGSPDGDVGDVVLSPDGTLLAFQGDLDADEANDIYIVPADSLDGSERIRVSNVLVEDVDGDGESDGYSNLLGWVGPDLK